jgi:molybdate transport system substrate-binding protein
LRRRPFAVMSAIAALLLVSACGGVAGGPASSPSAPQISGNLTVLAAASLTDAFTKIGDDLHRKYPGIASTFSFAGSPTLVTQIQQGAPADIFASADQANMQKVVNGGFASGTPSVFAHNKLEIAVQAGNPKHIASVTDLANSAIKVVVCAPGVPCGTYSTATFGKAGITVKPVSQEQDVKSVLTKVALREADAGIVYVTDVRAAKASGGQVDGVTIPDNLNTTAEYPIAELKTTQSDPAAKAFIDYVLSDDGQKTLESSGFMSRTTG